MVNGGFDDDIHAWKAANVVHEWDNGRNKITGASNNSRAGQSVPVSKGATYLMSCDIEQGTSSNARMLNQSDSITLYPTDPPIIFTTLAGSHIDLRLRTDFGSAWYDNVSIKRLIEVTQ